MGALLAPFGLGAAHQVQSPRGSAGFSDWGSDPNALMRNSSGTSSAGNPLMGQGGGGSQGFDPFSSLFGGGMGGGFNPLAMLMGQGVGQSGFGGQQGGGMQQRQQNPYGIVPPRGMQGSDPTGSQQAAQNPLAGLFGMLGGL